MEKMLDKIMATLVGLHIGDVLGMPTSMMTPEQIKKNYGFVDDVVEPIENHLIHSELKTGESTDDTMLAMMVVDELIENNGIVRMRKIANELVEWAIKNNMLDSKIIGPSTRNSLRTLIQGDSPEEAGKLGVTDGGAMKIAPIGLVNFKNMNILEQNVVNTCIPSHGTSIAISGAMAISYAIAACMRDSSLDKIMSEAIRGAEIGLKYGNIVPSANIAERIKLAMTIVDNENDEWLAAKKIYDLIGTSMHTNESVPAALGFFYLAKGDPKKAILYPVNIGDDADTIGSMCGALAGAYSGLNNFPEHWVEIAFNNRDANINIRAKKLYEVLKNQE